MINNCIICLGAGKSQLPIILIAKKMGFYVICIDRDAHSIGFSHAHKSIVISTYEVKLVIDSIGKLQSKYNIIGVVARSSGPALYTAAAIAEFFKLPGLSTNMITLATEKSSLRNHCETHNISFPRGQKINLSKHSQTKLNLPVIVKPDLPIVGKKDILVVTDKRKLQDALSMASNSSFNGLVEVEEYIPGYDVGCLFKVTGNKSKIIALWDELVGVRQDHSIVGCGVSVPSVSIGTRAEKLIGELVQKFALTLPKIEALLILAFRIDRNGIPYIIELHADLGGDLIADELFPASDPSYNYFESCISIATNPSIELSVPSFQPAAILYRDIFINKSPISRQVNIIKSESLSRLHSKIDHEFKNYDEKFHTKPLHSKLTYQKNI